MHTGEQISIWFFIGALLTVYGVLIMAAGIWSLVNPSATPPVLHDLHPGIWWGGLLLAIGAAYCHRYRPGKQR